MSCCNDEYQYNEKTHCCKRFPIKRREAAECKKIFDQCIKNIPGVLSSLHGAISVNMLPSLMGITAGGLIGYKFGGSIGASIGATLAGAFYTGKTIGETGVGILNFLEYSRECKINFIECMDCSN